MIIKNNGNVSIDGTTFNVDAVNNRVGIGTSGPSYQLDLDGGTTVNTRIRIARGSDDNQAMRLGYNSIDLFRNVALASAQTSLAINQVGSDGTRNVFQIDASGRVGIGITGPSAQLHVYAGSTTNTVQILEQASTAGAFTEYKNGTSDFYVGVNNSTGTLFSGVGGAYGSAIASYGAYSLGFGTNGTERARIDSSGRFLVGTDTAFTDGFNSALTSSQLSKGSDNNVRCISDTRSVAAVNNSTVDAWVGRKAAGTAFAAAMAGHFYVQVGGADAFSGVYSIVSSSLGTSSATLTAVSTVTRGTSPVSSVQIANDGAGGAIKLTITYINNAGVVGGLISYVSFVGLAG